MSTPLCPVHGVPMRTGRYGGFFCSQKMPSGDYCSEKVRGEGQSSRPPYGSTVPYQPSQPTGMASLRVAAIGLAARIYQGQPERADEALAFARRAIEELSQP